MQIHEHPLFQLGGFTADYTTKHKAGFAPGFRTFKNIFPPRDGFAVSSAHVQVNGVVGLKARVSRRRSWKLAEFAQPAQWVVRLLFFHGIDLECAFVRVGLSHKLGFYFSIGAESVKYFSDFYTNQCQTVQKPGCLHAVGGPGFALLSQVSARPLLYSL